jgi:hypothetical protein
VLSCARRVRRPFSPQVFDQFVANRIKQLPYGLVCESTVKTPGRLMILNLSSLNY